MQNKPSSKAKLLLIFRHRYPRKLMTVTKKKKKPSLPITLFQRLLGSCSPYVNG